MLNLPALWGRLRSARAYWRRPIPQQGSPVHRLLFAVSGEALADADANIRVGYPWWLRPWLARDVIAITLGRTIYLSTLAAQRSRESLEPLIRHELAHVRQVNRYGFLGFLARYGAEFLRHFVRVRSLNRAYSMISFEIEAMAAEREEKANGSIIVRADRCHDSLPCP